jgi:hypothetical protein
MPNKSGRAIDPTRLSGCNHMTPNHESIGRRHDVVMILQAQDVCGRARARMRLLRLRRGRKSKRRGTNETRPGAGATVKPECSFLPNHDKLGPCVSPMETHLSHSTQTSCRFQYPLHLICISRPQPKSCPLFTCAHATQEAKRKTQCASQPSLASHA